VIPCAQEFIRIPMPTSLGPQSSGVCEGNCTHRSADVATTTLIQWCNIVMVSGHVPSILRIRSACEKKLPLIMRATDACCRHALYVPAYRHSSARRNSSFLVIFSQILVLSPGPCAILGRQCNRKFVQPFCQTSFTVSQRLDGNVQLSLHGPL